MPTFQLCMHLLNNPKKKWCYQQQKQQKQQQQQWRQMPKNVYNKYSLRWATCNMWVITIVKFAVICGVFHARSYFEYWSLLWLYVTSRKHIYNNVHGDFAWKIAVKTHHLYCRSFIQPLFVSILVKSAVWDIFRCCFFQFDQQFRIILFWSLHESHDDFVCNGFWARWITPGVQSPVGFESFNCKLFKVHIRLIQLICVKFIICTHRYIYIVFDERPHKHTNIYHKYNT